MINKIKRIGLKMKNVAHRIGHKVKEVANKIGSKIGTISNIVDRSGLAISSAGNILAPLASSLNPTLGANIAKIGDGAGRIGKLAGRVNRKALSTTALVNTFVDKGLGLVDRAEAGIPTVIRHGRKALQNDATSMMYMRSLSKDMGSGALNLKQAYKKAKEIGMSKEKFKRALG